MADRKDAESLRKQISFLSNLIKSHKSEGGRPAVCDSSVDKNNSKQNKKWSRWQKNNGEQSSCIVGDAKKSNKKIMSTMTSSHSKNKFSLNKKPQFNSSRTPSSSNNSMSESASVKTSVLRRLLSSNKLTSPASNNQIQNNVNHKSSNKYKLTRNTSTVMLNKGQLAPKSIQLNQTQLNAPKRTSSPNMTTKWLSNKRKISKQTQMTRSDIIARGSKLKWRRKSLSQLNKSRTTERKNMQKKRQFKDKHVLTMSSSSLASSDVSISSTTTHSRHNQTYPRGSKLRWKRKSDTYISRKMTFAQKRNKSQPVLRSKYSLNRVNNSQTLHKQSGANNSKFVFKKQQENVQKKNKGFLARRMKYLYVANGCYPESTKVSNCDHIRTMNVNGRCYIVRSNGMILRKIPAHETPLSRNMSNTTFRRSTFSLHKTPNKSTSKLFRHKSLPRQSSIHKYKSDKANKILQRTIQSAKASLKRRKSTQYCMFYNKFGKCMKEKQGLCSYIHDPSKIAVCTRFLRGTCHEINGSCPFSHKLDKEKMPICQYFLKGKCTKDDCPYSHVNVGLKADVCQDFLKGYCALGFKCKKKHIIECEEYTTTGRCPNGTKCKLIHRQRDRKRYFQGPIEQESTPSTSKKLKQRTSDSFLPLEFLSESEESTTESESNNNTSTKLGSLKIRPRFR